MRDSAMSGANIAAGRGCPNSGQRIAGCYGRLRLPPICEDGLSGITDRSAAPRLFNFVHPAVVPVRQRIRSPDRRGRHEVGAATMPPAENRHFLTSMVIERGIRLPRPAIYVTKVSHSVFCR
jgi:hypothetical protein